MLYIPTLLKEVIDEIELRGWMPPGATKQQMLDYANEDTYGGRDTGWPDGVAIYSWEGKIIYALVRLMNPETCLEIGTADGCSATHILAALRANNKGHLYSIDLNPNAGDRIPYELRDRWSFTAGDGTVAPYPEHVDFCFEDGSHMPAETRLTLERMKAAGAKVVMSHDSILYTGVRFAFEDVFNHQELLIWLQGTITGMSVWMNPSSS